MATELCTLHAASNIDCEIGKANDITKCDKCMPGFVLMTGVVLCSAITVPNCLIGTASTPNSCEHCKPGFHRKADKSSCDAMPEGCMATQFDTTIKCTDCDYSNGYVATDIKGTARFTVGGIAYWEQVCTKSTIVPGTTLDATCSGNAGEKAGAATNSKVIIVMGALALTMTLYL